MKMISIDDVIRLNGVGSIVVLQMWYAIRAFNRNSIRFRQNHNKNPQVQIKASSQTIDYFCHTHTASIQVMPTKYEF